MKLTEMKPTELIELAIKDGCVTAEEYDHWLDGYIKGLKVMTEYLLKKETFSDDVQIERDEEDRLNALDIDEEYEKASFNAGEIL